MVQTAGFFLQCYMTQLLEYGNAASVLLRFSFFALSFNSFFNGHVATSTEVYIYSTRALQMTTNRLWLVSTGKGQTRTRLRKSMRSYGSSRYVISSGANVISVTMLSLSRSAELAPTMGLVTF